MREDGERGRTWSERGIRFASHVIHKSSRSAVRFFESVGASSGSNINEENNEFLVRKVAAGEENQGEIPPRRRFSESAFGRFWRVLMMTGSSGCAGKGSVRVSIANVNRPKF